MVFLFSQTDFFLVLSLAWYAISFFFNSFDTTLPLDCALVLYSLTSLLWIGTGTARQIMEGLKAMSNHKAI